MSKRSEKKKPSSRIAHNFNPNVDTTDEQAYQSREPQGALLGDNDNLLNQFLVDAKSQSSKMSKITRGSKRSKKSTGPKMVSFREMREIQRLQEASHMGPGTHDTLKPFGSGLNKVSFGNKYKFDAGQNPGPGQYEPTKASSVVHPKSFEAFIKDGRRFSAVDATPDAGSYDPDQGFGKIPQKMTWQGKYKFVPDSNPPPGYYSPEKAEDLVRPKSSAFKQSTEKRSKKLQSDVPEAGKYNPHKKFGTIPQKMTWQGKYKFVPDSNPPPGLYDPDHQAIKPRSSKAVIKEDKGLKVPKEVTPDGGMYEPHKKFGSIPQNMTWQGNYKFVPDSNPPPGLYDPDVQVIKPSSSKAYIKKETGYKVTKEIAPGPGQYDGHLKPFGTISQNMTWQGNYKFVPDSNPPPGLYDPDKEKVLNRSQSAWIKRPLVEEKSRETGPSPGQYDGHLKPFGSLPQNMTWQGNYKFVPDSNPPPGLYEPDRANELTKPRSHSYSQSKERRSKPHANDVPDAGDYNPDKGFAHIPNKMTLGGPYQWKADENPGPGTYEADKSLDSIKHSSPSAVLHQPLIPEKRAQDPSPQVYDGHLKGLGEDTMPNIDFGNKYKFSVNDVPPPGYYNPERAESLTKSRSPAAKIHQETMVPLEPFPIYSIQEAIKENSSESTPKPQMAPEQVEQNYKSAGPSIKIKKSKKK